MPALSEILDIARGDTGGSRMCAMFLLSLWDGNEFRADLQSFLYCDTRLFEKMMSIMTYLQKANKQLDDFITQAEINPILEARGKQFMARAETE